MFVILLHTGATFEFSFQNPWPWCGVPLFVMLSGALLLTPTKVAERLGTFFRKRLNRIALPFLFWAVVYFAWRRFADHEILTFDSILRDFLGVGSGANQYPYYHFWFLYMLFGLYLLTPVLRIVVAHASSRILGYLLLLWFIGTAVMPLFGAYGLAILNSQLFIIPVYLGFFVLGSYLQTVNLDSKVTSHSLLLSALVLTLVGIWLVTIAGSGHDQLLAINVILASSILFLLLRGLPLKNTESNFPRVKKLLGLIGQYSLGIYLLHPIVLEILGVRGLFGYYLDITTLNPILGIPILFLATLAVCFVAIGLLRKVPILKKAIG